MMIQAEQRLRLKTEHHSAVKTDGGQVEVRRRTVRRQEVAETLEDVLPSYWMCRQMAILETDGMHNCHTPFFSNDML